MNKHRVIGRIHSIESFGAVDGPGVRFVAFLQGCPLRCKYCHNPDTWKVHAGKTLYADDLVEEIKSYHNFIKGGGVTLSGGEPLLQTDFCLEVLRLCKQAGYHTAVDTSGCMPLEKIKPVLEYTDLVLLDIKDIDTDDAKILTGMGNENSFALLDYCEKIHKPVWIRHVLLRGYTFQEDKLNDLAVFLKGYSCIEKVELLPFHKMGEFKWETLEYAYELADIKELTNQEVNQAKEIFRNVGFNM